MFISILFLFYQLEISDTQFNLYHTDRSLMMNEFRYDCLYHVPNARGVLTFNGLIPFCIRPRIIKQADNKENLCYGKTITFKELKTNNISVDDLFNWNAVIEIIDLYEKYLLFPHLVNGNEVYCNCSLLTQFGKFCQYEINVSDTQRNFNYLLHQRKQNEERQPKYSTCYIGLRCQTNLICLDWRQICNVIIDCDHGEDEPTDLCLQMEANRCDSKTEFRCKNGLCVPMITMAYASFSACLDRSDQTKILGLDAVKYLPKSPVLCFDYPPYECDEINLGWKQFSCNNGQSMSYEDLTSKISDEDKTCANNHHLIYLRKLFSTNDKNKCWKSMICLTGFDYLYSNISCLNENIEQNCPNEFYFPPNSVVYSFIYFLYDKTNRNDWFTYTGPNYICYQKEFCLNYTFNQSTIIRNNLICFFINQTNFSWKNFYEYILHLFSPCFYSSIQINDQMFYKCNLSQSFISIYRVKDKNKDCFYNEDEDLNIDLCSLNTIDQFKCLTNQKQCVRRAFLGDNEYDCTDGSDEYVKRLLHVCDNFCEVYNFKEITLPETYAFGKLCDKIADQHLFSLEPSETDETDCEYWPYTCYSYFTVCNGVWNCPNGRDEVNCKHPYISYIRSVLGCQSNEHYCIQLVDNSDVNANCINMNRAGDGIVDCIGGTDERLTNICLEKYPMEFKRRFLCMNSSLCIRPDQVCDRSFDCPFHDDELFCPWLFQNSTSTFYCQDSFPNPITRCDINRQGGWACQNQTYSLFCDLESQQKTELRSIEPTFELYPSTDEDIVLIEKHISNSYGELILKNELLSFTNTNSYLSLCNIGYPIQSSVLNNTIYCLCPPSYYGEFCQYQSERITVLLRIETRYYVRPLTVFRLIIYLLNETNFVLSFDEIVYNRKSVVSGHPHLKYLLSERMTNLSLHEQFKSKFIRIDSYIINETSVQYISSWFFNVSFPFLPVNRLAVDLFLVNESYRVLYCTKKCGSHGKCMHYINSREKEYCWCDQGWFGENCQLKSSFNLCNSTSCSSHSQCIILNEEKQQMQCICPLGKEGDQCYITYNLCAKFLCILNQTCLQRDRLQDVRCICNDSQKVTAVCGSDLGHTRIFIDANITDLPSIPAIIVSFGAPDSDTYRQAGYLFKNVVLPGSLKLDSAVSKFGFIRIFYNFSKSFYYLISIRENGFLEYVNTSVIPRNLCPNVSELFNQTILTKYSYLKRLKLYHLPCNQNHNLRCFFDEYRMCICTQDYNSDCYFFYHNYYNCDYCKNDGLCLRQDFKWNQWNYVCLCSECSFGSLCQFKSGSYFITLDMLIGIDIKTGNSSFSDQSTIVHLTLMFVLFLLILNLIINTFGIIVFSNKELRQVGCDLYLFYLTITSQIGLILLFLRFIYMIITQIYTINNLLFLQIGCISLEYLIRLIPSLFDWLTVCVSIERAYTIIKGVKFTRVIALKTMKLSHLVVSIVVILNVLSTLHRPFYLVLVDESDLNDEPKGHPWCVLDLALTSWNIYEKIINIFHLIVPFILNLLSITIFILRKTNIELTSKTRKKQDIRWVIMKEQLLKYKLLIISPIIILILEIPRFVLIFTLACIKYPWQRYTHLAGYITSFLPLLGVVFIYILPSPKYKKYAETLLKKITCRTTT